MNTGFFGHGYLTSMRDISQFIVFNVLFGWFISTQQFTESWQKQRPNKFKSLWSLQNNFNCFFSNHTFGHMCQAFSHEPWRYFNINDHCLALSHIPHILAMVGVNTWGAYEPKTLTTQPTCELPAEEFPHISPLFIADILFEVIFNIYLLSMKNKFWHALAIKYYKLVVMAYVFPQK